MPSWRCFRCCCCGCFCFCDEMRFSPTMNSSLVRCTKGFRQTTCHMRVCGSVLGGAFMDVVYCVVFPQLSRLKPHTSLLPQTLPLSSTFPAKTKTVRNTFHTGGPEPGLGRSSSYHHDTAGHNHDLGKVKKTLDGRNMFILNRRDRKGCYKSYLIGEPAGVS